MQKQNSPDQRKSFEQQMKEIEFSISNLTDETNTQLKQNCNILLKKIITNKLNDKEVPMQYLNYVENQNNLHRILCGSCIKPIKHHVQLRKCFHTLCQDCAFKICQTDDCPICHMQIASVCKDEQMLAQQQRVHVYCVNYCGWSGELRNLEKHSIQCDTKPSLMLSSGMNNMVKGSNHKTIPVQLNQNNNYFLSEEQFKQEEIKKGARKSGDARRSSETSNEQKQVQVSNNMNTKSASPGKSAPHTSQFATTAMKPDNIGSQQKTIEKINIPRPSVTSQQSPTQKPIYEKVQTVSVPKNIQQLINQQKKEFQNIQSKLFKSEVNQKGLDNDSAQLVSQESVQHFPQYANEQKDQENKNQINNQIQKMTIKEESFPQQDEAQENCIIKSSSTLMSQLMHGINLKNDSGEVIMLQQPIKKKILKNYEDINCMLEQQAKIESSEKQSEKFQLFNNEISESSIRRKTQNLSDLNDEYNISTDKPNIGAIEFTNDQDSNQISASLNQIQCDLELLAQHTITSENISILLQQLDTIQLNWVDLCILTQQNGEKLYYKEEVKQILQNIDTQFNIIEQKITSFQKSVQQLSCQANLLKQQFSTDSICFFRFVSAKGKHSNDVSSDSADELDNTRDNIQVSKQLCKDNTKIQQDIHENGRYFNFDNTVLKSKIIMNNVITNIVLQNLKQQEKTAPTVEIQKEDCLNEIQTNHVAIEQPNQLIDNTNIEHQTLPENNLTNDIVQACRQQIEQTNIIKVEVLNDDINCEQIQENIENNQNPIHEIKEEEQNVDFNTDIAQNDMKQCYIVDKQSLFQQTVQQQQTIEKSTEDSDLDFNDLKSINISAMSSLSVNEQILHNDIRSQRQVVDQQIADLESLIQSIQSEVLQ